MAFESLTEKFSKIFKKLKSKGKLTDSDIRSSLSEVRIALLEADVNFKVAKNFIKSIEEKAVDTNILECLTPAQMMIKIVNNELTNLLGGEDSKFKFSNNFPMVIMVCGIQGSGKTTQSVKLALYLKKNSHRPLLVACDTYRAAAVEQLETLGASAKIPVFSVKDSTTPCEIARKAISNAKDMGYDVVIVDTAGRMQIDTQMMNELKMLRDTITPDETLLVADTMTGQDAVNIAKTFSEEIGITGIILTKLDGDTRGGAALSIKSITNKPIKFIGTGEKLENFEVFHPDRMASRILGMGDVLGLIEEAESNFNEQQAKKMVQKLEKNKFDLDDLVSYFNQVKKMGPLKSIISKLPGVGSKLDNIDINDKIIDKPCAIVYSMTKSERSNPEIIGTSRKRRIAAGCGMKVEDVNQLLRQFEQTKKLVKNFSHGGMFQKIMRFGRFGH